MKDMAVSIRDLKKRYRLYDSPMDRFIGTVLPGSRRRHRDFWALNGIALEIPKGITFGIVGLNGSGKSTLLKVIAGILTPTEGHVEVRGRISALLKIGSGYSPHMTGRENVLMNAVISGIPQHEIEEKIEDVRAFADIGDFFDLPMQTYSSGMYSRLAFSAAISVQPDILIVDEVLSVGDARFQEKCHRKINGMRDDGVTILLVSHSTPAVLENCDAAALLDKGQLVAHGTAIEVIDGYYRILYETPESKMPVMASKKGQPGLTKEDQVSKRNNFFLDKLESREIYNKFEDRILNGPLRIFDAFIEQAGEINPSTLSGTETMKLTILVDSEHGEFPDELNCGFSIHSISGICLYGSNTQMGPKRFEVERTDTHFIFMTYLTPFLKNDTYFLNLAIFRKDEDGAFYYDRRLRCISIQIGSSDDFAGFIDLGVTSPDE